MLCPLPRETYEHFMLKEILNSPKHLEQALHNRFIEDFGTVEFENFIFHTPRPASRTPYPNPRLRNLLACRLHRIFLFEEKARIPTQAEIASEFRYKNPIVSENTLVIAISQSGETLDTIAAIREAKQKALKSSASAMSEIRPSSREADASVFLRAGPEISVCSTKAFTSQLTILSLLAL